MPGTRNARAIANLYAPNLEVWPSTSESASLSAHKDGTGNGRPNAGTA
jgi:hypothetical protein